MPVLSRFDHRVTFAAVADEPTDVTERRWPWCAEALVAGLRVRAGQHLLDVATGRGAIALRAAPLVGPSGTVTALDAQPGMLREVKSRALQLGLDNVQRVEADMSELPFVPASFDVVTCGLALQYPAEPVAVLRALWDVLRPGGQLGLAVLAQAPFATYLARYAAAAQAVRSDVAVAVPDAERAGRAWITRTLRTAGIASYHARLQVREVPLRTADDVLDVVRGTAYRHIHDQLGDEERHRVYDQVGRWIAATAPDRPKLGVLHIFATKPRVTP